MKHLCIAAILMFCTFASNGQINYSGSIDKYSIELVTYIYSDGVARAIYAYKSHNMPMSINGRLAGKVLTLYEIHGKKDTAAVFVFSDYNAKNSIITGYWKDIKTQKELSVTLVKEFDLDTAGPWKNREIIQPEALKDFYFKLLVSKDAEQDEPHVTGIKILNKKTNEVYQEIPLNCQFMSIENVTVDDYNFDGYDDFSVFESSHAGPNTSSLYFLYDPKTKSFFDSNFQGTSLDFDKNSKTIWEHNQCCAGRISTAARYKVVKNKMVLIEKHCYIYDEKKDDYVEKKWKECE